MRSQDIQEVALYSYVSPEQRVPADHPLRPIREMVNAVLRTLSAEFDKIYSIGGRPSIPPERLLRALLLQVLYTVRSERMMMEQLNYSVLYRWFVGLNMEMSWNRSTPSTSSDPARIALRRRGML